MKLKINGKLASFNGYLKGTIYIDGSPYDWDNTEQPEPHWEVLSDINFSTQAGADLLRNADLGPGTSLNVPNTLFKRNENFNITYNATEECTELTNGTDRYGLDLSTDLTGGKYLIQIRMKVHDNTDLIPSSFTTSITPCTFYLNVGESNTGAKNDFGQFGVYEYLALSNRVEWGFRKEDGTNATRENTFKNWTDKWIDWEIQIEENQITNIYMNGDYIGRIWPEMLNRNFNYIRLAGMSKNNKIIDYWNDLKVSLKYIKISKWVE